MVSYSENQLNGYSIKYKSIEYYKHYLIIITFKKIDRVSANYSINLLNGYSINRINFNIS